MTLPSSTAEARRFPPDLGGKVLREVSRSFYLSLRLLPAGMREPCGLGYLLARLADTVADTASIPLEDRVRCLGQLRVLYLGEEAPDRDELQSRLASMLPHLDHEGERRLVEGSDACLDELSRQSPESREALGAVLDAITAGQLRDLALFGGATGDGEPARFTTDVELIQYADDVAGSVGRFWTRIAVLAGERFSAPEDALMEWGTSYGRALQYINILRDVHEDVPRGRSYLPGDPDAWLERAAEGLRDGIRYSGHVNGLRLRGATVLPALIGAATLRCLRESRGDYLRRRIKVSRREVRRILGGTLCRVLLRRPLEPYFQALLGPKGENASGTGASRDSSSPVTG